MRRPLVTLLLVLLAVLNLAPLIYMLALGSHGPATSGGPERWGGPWLAVLAALAFQHYWSDFFWPLVITQEARHFTVHVGLAYLAQSEFGPQLPLMAAGATAAALPLILIFLAVRRHLFEGLRSGVLRG